MIKTIIQRIESGDLTRATDIQGNAGFYDYTKEIVEKMYLFMSEYGVLPYDSFASIHEKLYNDYWEIYEKASGYCDPSDIPF